MVGVLAVLVLMVVACSPAGSKGGSGATPAQAGSLTAAPSGDDPADQAAYAEFYQQRPTWKRCGSEGFQCTTVTVPVDWKNPSGATLKLAVTRKQASGTKIGSLFYNPGGPGASGVEYAPYIVEQLPASIRRVYDFVSWDTRGVGQSEPAVQCLPNSQLDAYYAIDATPDTPTEESTLVSQTKQYAAACEEHTNHDVLDHLDTISTVHDMDVMRAVVGDTRLTYLGASYGTYLGAWYAQTFPWRVGRLVLDGAVDPSEGSAASAEAQAMGFSRATQSYIDNCLKSSGCPLRGTREDAMAQLEKLSAQIDATPLRTDGKRELTQALFQTGLLDAMYSKSSWSTLTEGLRQAMQGDGSTMLLLADSYLQRDTDGQYGQLLQVFSPIYCLDHPDTRSVEEIAADAQRLQAKYPPFGDVLGWGALTCAEWPVAGVVPAQRLTAKGAAPILVVGTTNDPATPYESAQSLASQLSSGHLLTLVGDGHTAYGNGNSCLDDAVNAYLLKGTLPRDGLRCS